MKSHQQTARELLAGNIRKEEYASFYHSYINLSSGADLFKRLLESKKKVMKITEMLTERKSLFRYAEDKWSIKEIIGHLTDTERIMAWRALAFARGDQAHYPGFDQDDYIKEANFDNVPLKQLIDDYQIVRQSTVSLFKSFSPEMLMKSGIASNCRFTVRSLGFIIAGHELHHLNIIRKKYLPEINDFNST